MDSVGSDMDYDLAPTFCGDIKVQSVLDQISPRRRTKHIELHYH